MINVLWGQMANYSMPQKSPGITTQTIPNQFNQHQRYKPYKEVNQVMLRRDTGTGHTVYFRSRFELGYGYGYGLSYPCQYCTLPCGFTVFSHNFKVYRIALNPKQQARKRYPNNYLFSPAPTIVPFKRDAASCTPRGPKCGPARLFGGHEPA
jgi:hypothetical protein